MKGATEHLAEFCANYSYKNLMLENLLAVKRCLIDFLGVALYGSVLPSSKIVVELVKDLGGLQESSLLGHNHKVPSPNAALVNGSMGHGLELDDVHKEASLHPGVTVIPAALAIAEREKTDGKMLATSIALGYEVMIRVGKSLNPEELYIHGFHPTAVCGVFGAAIAAGEILGFSKDQFISAMGISGSLASGILAFLDDVNWTKRMQAGWAAHSGLVAALLASKGYKGSRTVLEGRNGFIKSHSHNYDISVLTERLGERLLITDISFKRHACCYYNHSAIDATLKLVERYHVRAENVKEVIVSLTKVAIPIVADPLDVKCNVKSIVDAQFSLPFGIAVAISRRKAFIDEYSENAVNDIKIQNLMKKIKVLHDPKLDTEYPKIWPAVVQIRTIDGKTYTERVDMPKGDPRNPLSNKELHRKFSLLSSRVLPEERVKETIKMVWNLEKIKDISELTELLRP